ncbi:MAG: glutamate racemase [Planctomycetota bacterium]|jgi:glutamate racemase
MEAFVRLTFASSERTILHMGDAVHKRSECGNDRPIGVFDSGLGGLTVVREIAAAMGGEDIVYLGDSARVPYGIKSLDTVRRFALEDATFLLRFDPKLIVVACNTASAAAINAIEEFSPVPVVDVVRPGAAAALNAGDDVSPIGVIATEATIASGAYQRAIAAIAPEREVIASPCPLLVPIVEEGRDPNDPIVLHVLAEYLHELQRRRVGVLILGCTHYPLLTRAIAKLMGPEVRIINSGRAAAGQVQRRLAESNLGTARSEGGVLRCYTTDNAQRFAQLGERFGGRSIEHVEYVGTDELEAERSEQSERKAERHEVV